MKLFKNNGDDQEEWNSDDYVELDEMMNKQKKCEPLPKIPESPKPELPDALSQHDFPERQSPKIPEAPKPQDVVVSFIPDNLRKQLERVYNVEHSSEVPVAPIQKVPFTEPSIPKVPGLVKPQEAPVTEVGKRGRPRKVIEEVHQNPDIEEVVEDNLDDDDITEEFTKGKSVEKLPEEFSEDEEEDEEGEEEMSKPKDELDSLKPPTKEELEADEEVPAVADSVKQFMRQQQQQFDQDESGGYKQFGQDEYMSEDEARARIATMLVNRKNLEMMSELNDYEIFKLAVVASIAQTYKVPLVELFADKLLGFKVSRAREGRREVKEVAAPSKVAQDKKSVMDMIMGGRKM